MSRINSPRTRLKLPMMLVLTMYRLAFFQLLLLESGRICKLEWSILIMIAQGNTYYYHTDHLGTPHKMTDSNQSIVWSAYYKPFGAATVTVSTITNNLRFPGQYYDAETGNNYNYFRDYNPTIGRYIESDPAYIYILNINPYTYVENRPVTKTDRLGLFDDPGGEGPGLTGTSIPVSPPPPSAYPTYPGNWKVNPPGEQCQLLCGFSTKLMCWGLGGGAGIGTGGPGAVVSIPCSIITNYVCKTVCPPLLCPNK
jgi:RHS repeat-associated protein